MLQYMRIMLRAQARDEKGASAVEYGLLVSLIAVAIVGAVLLLGTTLDGIFDTTESKIKPPAPTA